MRKVAGRRPAAVNLRAAGAGSLPVVALVAILSLGMPAPWASAQQARSGAPGWLGIRFQEYLECERPRSSASLRCRKPLLVTGIAAEGPAQRAGVLPGDTLISIDGRPLTAEHREKVFASLREGSTIRLRVGREGGRRVLRVVPAHRPARLGAVSWAGPRRVAPVAAGARAARSAPRPGSEAWLSPALDDTASWVLSIRGDSAGFVRVVPVPLRIDTSGSRGYSGRLVMDDGTVLNLPSDTGAARRLRFVLSRRSGAQRGRGGAGGSGASSNRARWIELDLGPKWKEMRDSLFATAKLRLDSLRSSLAWRARRTFEARGGREPRETPAARYSLRASAGGRGEEVGTAVAPLASERRIAGAEFEPLTPELAEFFPGADTGLLVLRVLASTPAARLGLRPGDVVFQVGDRRTRDLMDLRSALVKDYRSRRVKVKWLRKGVVMTGMMNDD
ncbi:MAG: PDZ domain-containing protein [Gemmatimonadota bacterium]